MKKNLLIISAFALSILGTTAFIKSSNGIAGKTGAPGEQTCSGCHSGGQGATTVSISSIPAFVSNQYIPGQSYTVNITVSSTALSAFGFGCEILNGTTQAATNAGVISSIAGSSQILNNGAKTNATHISASAGSGSPSSKTFSFKWVAPTSGTAAIYAAGNAVNSNGGTSGDLSNSTSLILTPNVSSGINANTKEVVNLNVYPNPIAETINLQYVLLKSGNVKASIFDIQGKEVDILIDENQMTGNFNNNFSVSKSVKSGVYFIKLSVDGKIMTQKMIIKQ